VALMPCVPDYGVDYDGIVMDFQIDVQARNDSHTFFISDFLGCKPFKDPKTTTQEFYKHTKSFIKLIDGEIKRAKYIQDLNSCLVFGRILHFRRCVKNNNRSFTPINLAIIFFNMPRN